MYRKYDVKYPAFSLLRKLTDKTKKYTIVFAKHEIRLKLSIIDIFCDHDNDYISLDTFATIQHLHVCSCFNLFLNHTNAYTFQLCNCGVRNSGSFRHHNTT